MLQYPLEDRRPWDALFFCCAYLPSAPNSPNSSINHGSELDPGLNQSDHASAISGASTNFGLPSQLFNPSPNNEPGALNLAPAQLPLRTPPAVSSSNEDRRTDSNVNSNERNRLVAPVLSRSSAFSTNTLPLALNVNPFKCDELVAPVLSRSSASFINAPPLVSTLTPQAETLVTTIYDTVSALAVDTVTRNSIDYNRPTPPDVSLDLHVLPSTT